MYSLITVDELHHISMTEREREIQREIGKERERERGVGEGSSLLDHAALLTQACFIINGDILQHTTE